MAGDAADNARPCAAAKILYVRNFVDGPFRASTYLGSTRTSRGSFGMLHPRSTIITT